MPTPTRLFRFALVTSDTARAATVICDAAPMLRTDSPRVQAFFREFPQVRVELLRHRPDDADEKQMVLQYVSPRHGTPYVYIKGGLPVGLKEATLRRRLYNEFCVRHAVVPLRNQATLLEYFGEMDWARDGLEDPFFTYWEMGSGKTLALLLATLGSAKPPRRILVVCSNTLVGHWTDAVMRVHMPPPPPQVLAATPDRDFSTVVHVVGFTNFKANAQELMDGTDVAIVDECQEFRGYTRDQRLAVQELQRAPSLFLLSGTPLVNSSQDMMGLLALMGEHIHDVSASGANWTRRDGTTVAVAGPAWRWPVAAVRQVFQGNVSFYVPRLHASVDFQAVFPKVERHHVRVPLSLQQTFKYLVVRGHLAAPPPRGWQGATRSLTFKSPTGNYYNNRQVEACNEADILTDVVPKAQWVVRHLSDPATRARDLPMVVHSNFIHKGTRLIQAALRHAPRTRALRTAEIIGTVAARERDTIIAAFNDGQVDVLFISKAASTGVSLRGARSFVIEEAFPNVSSEEQTVGRVIRADSHPEGHGATVRVFKLTATFAAPLRQLTSAPTPASRDLVDPGSVSALGDWFREEAASLWPRAMAQLRRLLPTRAAWCQWLLAVTWAGIAEEGFQTVNEQFETRNQEKAAALAVYTTLLRDCSIDMPLGSMKVAPPSKFATMSASARHGACKRALAADLKRRRPAWLGVVARWTMCVNAALRRTLDQAPDDWLALDPATLVRHPDFTRTFDTHLKAQLRAERARIATKRRKAAAKVLRAAAREAKAHQREADKALARARRDAREAEWARKRAEKAARKRKRSAAAAVVVQLHTRKKQPSSTAKTKTKTAKTTKTAPRKVRQSRTQEQEPRQGKHKQRRVTK